MNWVQNVVDAYQDTEAPERFIYWSALTSMSAVIRKNVKLQRHISYLYPNIYTFLVASSGMGKSVPIIMARKLVEFTDATRIVMGRGSMPRILQDLGKAYTRECGDIIKDAQAFLISGELAAFLVKDPDALTILTDLHDTHSYEEFWTNSLKGSGTDKLKAPCITLLGATNEDHFSEAVPSNAIGGGFIARTFIVFSDEKGTLNSLTTKPKSTPDLKGLSVFLKDLSKVKGEFLWDPKAQKMYDEWYYDFYRKKFHDTTGTFNRLKDQILKVAMLVSLSDNFSLVLHEKHIFEAITVCEACVTGMQQVTMGTGNQSLAAATKIVMRELIQSPVHKLNKSDLLRRYWGQFDDFDLVRVAETLQAAQAITITPCGKDYIYEMKKTTLELYTNFRKGIQ